MQALLHRALEFNSTVKQPLNFFHVSLGMLVSNPFPRDLTSQLVELQGHGQPLLPRHLAIPFDLFFQGLGRIHENSMIHSLTSHAAEYS